MANKKRQGKKLSRTTSSLDYFTGFHSVVRRSDESIEVLKGMVGLAGGMMTIGVMMLIGLIWMYLCLMLPAAIEGESPGSLGFIISIFISVFFFLAFFFLIYIFGFAPYFITRYIPSPIRFNRKTREIYIMQDEIPKKKQKSELLRFSWDTIDIRRQMSVLPSGNGPPRIEYKTFLYGENLNDDKRKIHSILIGTGTALEEHQDLLWEYIRRFMENKEIQVKVKDKSGNEIIRRPTAKEEFCDLEEMSEYLPFWEQLKFKLRFNFIYPYTGVVIPRLKGYNPELNMGNKIGNIIQFIYYQIKFLVLLVYPFFAFFALPGMLISSWLFGTKKINEFPGKNNDLCGLGSLNNYIGELLNNRDSN